MQQHWPSIAKQGSFNAGGGGGATVTLGVEAPYTGRRKFSISGCRRHSSVELGENQFLLTIVFSNADTNESISYKRDGSRFDGSQFTLKFHTNTLYKIYLKTKPAQEFLSLNIAGNDLKLCPIDGGNGEYAAIWNTADKAPTKAGTRQDIDFILSGTQLTLNKKLQAKFYMHNDNHAGWGQKLDQITWQCIHNDIGYVSVMEEQTL